MTTHLKYIVIIFILLFVILLTLNIRYSCKINNKITILQSNNPHKDILEEELAELSPTLIENAIEKNIDTSNYTLSYMKNSYSKTNTNNLLLIKYVQQTGTYENISTPFDKFIDWMIKNEETKTNEIFYLESSKIILLKQLNLYDKFNDFARYYLQPLNINSSYSLSIGNKYVESKLKKVNNKRMIICQIKGSCSFYLFNPLQEKYLYPSSKYINNEKISNVNFWKSELNSKKYPNFNKSQYIEIMLHEGYMFYIPNHWWYCYKHNSTSISVTIKSETMTDLIVKIPQVFN